MEENQHAEALQCKLVLIFCNVSEILSTFKEHILKLEKRIIPASISFVTVFPIEEQVVLSCYFISSTFYN